MGNDRENESLRDGISSDGSAAESQLVRDEVEKLVVVTNGVYAAIVPWQSCDGSRISVAFVASVGVTYRGRGVFLLLLNNNIWTTRFEHRTITSTTNRS